MPFDQEAELDPRLSGIALTALYSKYEQQFAGFELTGAMKKHSQSPEDPRIAMRLDKAIKATLADLVLLTEGVEAEGSEEVPGEVSNEQLLLEIYWRLHDGWKAATAPDLKMIDVADGAPSWPDLAIVLGELASLDRDGSEGDTYPAEWYDDLLTRYELRLGKDKPKKVATKKATKKAAAPIRVPPEDAEIIDYSPKSTFLVDQWVRHPKFGVGYVVEAAQHATLEFGADRKVLAHVAIVTPPPPQRGRNGKPIGNTLELARAAGIEVKKVASRLEEEK